MNIKKLIFVCIMVLLIIFTASINAFGAKTKTYNEVITQFKNGGIGDIKSFLKDCDKLIEDQNITPEQLTIIGYIKATKLVEHYQNKGAWSTIYESERGEWKQSLSKALTTDKIMANNLNNKEFSNLLYAAYSSIVDMMAESVDEDDAFDPDIDLAPDMFYSEMPETAKYTAEIENAKKYIEEFQSKNAQWSTEELQKYYTKAKSTQTHLEQLDTSELSEEEKKELQNTINALNIVNTATRAEIDRRIEEARVDDDSVTITDITNPITNPNAYKPGETGNESAIASKANVILGIINAVGIIVAVAGLMLIGIKYMFASIEEKAKYKETMLPYIVGLILLASGSTIVNILYNIGKSLW